jgi:uncharacterized membrane protein
MRTRAFLSKVDHERIVAAIVEAEKRTSGEIRVFVSQRRVENALAAAAREFERLKMHRTRERNGVLLYVAPRSQTFSIVGDEAIHRKCADGFWQEIASEMSQQFQGGKFTEGIVQAIEKAGKLLAQHFPRSPTDKNELPDSVSEG